MRRTATTAAAPAATHGPPTMNGSIHVCDRSTRVVPTRAFQPLWVTSLRIPVWVS